MSENEDGVMVYQEANNEPIPIADMVKQVEHIQKLMKAVMQDGEHYGKIPGTQKPTLLKAGAEKICMAFRLRPKFLIERLDYDNGHREYIVTCEMKDSAGRFLGEGSGSCSSLEAKYRYRNASDYEVLDEEIPKDAKEKKQEYRNQGYGMKQVEGQWVWVKYTSSGKVENPDLADTFNTVLKMAQKRALVAAVLTVTAASDIFTQDVEDLPADMINKGGSNMKSGAKPDTSDTQQRSGGSSTSGAPATESQVKMINIRLSKAGMPDGDERFLTLTEWLGRDITSTTQIKKAEVNDLLARIDKYAADMKKLGGQG